MFLFQTAGDVYHGELDDVGRASLYRGVYCVSFGQRPYRAVFGIDVGKVSPASEKCFYVSFFPGSRYSVLNVCLDSLEIGKISFDQFFGFIARDSEPLGEAECGDAVYDAEIGGFRPSSLFLGHFVRICLEYF